MFISETGKIEASPRLEVASNDVKASHSCKVEKVNKDKKFYLESRGLNDKEATKLILEANINSLFLDLENKKNILSQILEF
ncbi:MAG: SufD family Fe-S cluster assembly protein [Candidatus Peribacteria bacterium]|nr:SufD family Fe-S cluster assembly protein [Candidatus Peribacteria bacterium]